ncbi:LpxL/LpxP family Kdo(2)-lipid IV(A) lauroyl/palmitoleoyl acyltransferase [Biformimicrobium ophioploci]|uniref:Lipid A biosynthesis acyltransferase n=1 Tax=Biformimicrobium ophioploci TaxID=3036711 RepID=A0ABQ6LYR1_9GAMM|nr:LpxL/LpxP family Kdo(2)-lipid IV(A) lauroyl/palmitoleoyl acyltransferase [Microbulbifer sp. NKW57]GMG87214.1 lipid A biosynthesis lauroyl acyltransferase [Microbulbifer sp. NKW57]
MDRPHFTPALLHPRYWFTWLAIGLWVLVAHLPYGWQLSLGRQLGRFMQKFAKRRRVIAERNLALCFPEKSDEERAQLLHANFDSMGIALMETGMAWFRSTAWIQKLFTLEGAEHLEGREQGVVLLAMHFTTLEIGAGYLNSRFAIDGMYRAHKNPVYDYVQRKGREKHSRSTRVYPREDVRGMMRALKGGRTVWYAPDQDYGIKQGVFAPLFGIQAATVTGTSRFARAGKAAVVPYCVERLPQGRGYCLRVYPQLEDIPSGDEYLDACSVNRFVEARLRELPEQYMWVHRRFKTRPEGEADVYGLPKRKRKRRRSREREKAVVSSKK